MAAAPSMTGAPFLSQLSVGVERTLVAPILPGEVSGAMQSDWSLFDMHDQTK
jgi:hypothetical protein